MRQPNLDQYNSYRFNPNTVDTDDYDAREDLVRTAVEDRVRPMLYASKEVR